MTDQAATLKRFFWTRDGQLGRMRIMTIASGKGGVGKSNIAVNLAILLAQRGKQVIIFDADMGMANVDVLLGMVPRYTLRDVIRGERTLDEILQSGPGGIKIIAGASGIQELTNIDHYQREKLVNALYELEQKADFLLIDTGGGISRNVLSFMAAAEEVVVVLTPEPTSLTDAYSMIKIYSRFELHSRINIIVNRARNNSEARQTAQRIKKTVERFLNVRVDYLGCVCDDRHVVLAVKEQKPFCLLYPKGTATKNLSLIVTNLLSNEDGQIGVRESTGFVKRLIRLFT